MVSKKSRYLFFWLPYDVKYSYETFLTAFYLSIKRFPCEDAIHIGHERIFQDVPSHLPKNWLEGFSTAMPESEEIRALDKIIWSSDVFSNLENDLKSKNLVWEHILTKEYEPLMKLFESELAGIKKEFDIKAIILWSNCPSIKKVALNHDIPVIHNELGPLRDPVYLPTCYFDFSGVNGHTEAAERYKYYDASSDKYADFGRMALLSLFLKIIKPIRRFNEYDIGVPLQVEDDSNIIAYSKGFDNSELINYAKNQASKVLIRKHPYGRVDYKDIETGSENLTPQEFIALCEKIVTINSSVGFEALLWGKQGEILGDSPFSFINFESADFINALRFALLHYLVPFEFLFNKDYYDWRITMPDENSIAEKNLYHYLNIKHGWNKKNISLSKIASELESIFVKSLNLQFVENENLIYSEIKNLKKELLNLKADLIKKTIENESLSNKNKNLADELYRHQDIIEKIYASKSWHLTKPLRHVNSIKKRKDTRSATITLKNRAISLVIPVAKKLLKNYHVRRFIVFLTKKTGVYGKLKSIYLQGIRPAASSLINVADEIYKSRDSVTNIKKIRILKKQRGND
ncbi:GT99 family glycosyltransferase N-terminal domain-containing protein [Pantoea agglomerans]|uniref:GT99 family glycosyltransferase N-terminal domain-containing protein n=1 Tax=Enterobacter agglomerans TaxID=549 RepID=UPI001CC0BE63|nr:hypothetical protein [Pantoea agglomerans]